MTVFNNWRVANKGMKRKKKFSDNHLHNILKLFDVLQNFIFTTSETMSVYYL